MIKLNRRYLLVGVLLFVSLGVCIYLVSERKRLRFDYDWCAVEFQKKEFFEVELPLPYANELKEIIHIQWSDNTKARIINAQQNNRYRKSKSVTKVRAQFEIFDYLRSSVSL